MLQYLEQFSLANHPCDVVPDSVGYDLGLDRRQSIQPIGQEIFSNRREGVSIVERERGHFIAMAANLEHFRERHPLRGGLFPQLADHVECLIRLIGGALLLAKTLVE